MKCSGEREPRRAIVASGTFHDPELSRLPFPAGQAALLVWTTTPWTLVSNTAVAVHPEVTYVVATDGTEQLVVAEALVGQALGEGWTPTGQSFTGKELENWRYRRPFELVDIPDAHIVILAGYVTIDSGTGLVHQAPAFGADDLASCRA